MKIALPNLLNQYLIRPRRLKRAIREVVSEHNGLLRLLSVYEKNNTPTNLTWEDNGIWKSWDYNKDNDRYYFNDVGSDSLTELWEEQNAWVNSTHPLIVNKIKEAFKNEGV